VRVHIAVVASAIVLAGCATAGNYKKVLDTWVGAPEVNLVRQWSPPIQTYDAGGRKFLVYASSRSDYMPGSAGTYQTTVVGNTAYTNKIGGTPAMNFNYRCQTTFELLDEFVVAYRFQGNDCKARAPKG